jgi:hypothetical protein
MPRKLTQTEFIDRSIAVHGNKYDYSRAEYTTGNKPIRIICPIHGEFMQLASGHLAGYGCILCAGVKLKTTDEFISDARKIHGNKYDYSLVVYKN